MTSLIAYICGFLACFVVAYYITNWALTKAFGPNQHKPCRVCDIAQFCVVVLLRLIFVAPLLLLGYFLLGLSALLEHCGNGPLQIARRLTIVTSAPYVNSWKKQLAAMDEEKRRQALKELIDRHE